MTLHSPRGFYVVMCKIPITAAVYHDNANIPDNVSDNIKQKWVIVELECDAFGKLLV